MKLIRTVMLAPALLAARALSACGGEHAPDGSGGGDAPAAVVPTVDNAPGTYRMAGSDQYVLDEDGTFERQEGGETLSAGTWAVDGDRVILTYPEGDSGEGIAAGETRAVGLDSRGLVLAPDSETPRSYPRR